MFTFTHNLAPGAARAQLGGGERTAAPAWQGRNTRFIYWYIAGLFPFCQTKLSSHAVSPPATSGISAKIRGRPFF